MRNNSPHPPKKTTGWKLIPARLKAAGFTVSYKCISADPRNPLWRANAVRVGQEWGVLAENLKTALVELEQQTQNTAGDWRDMMKKLARGAVSTSTAGHIFS